MASDHKLLHSMPSIGWSSSYRLKISFRRRRSKRFRPGHCIVVGGAVMAGGSVKCGAAVSPPTACYFGKMICK